MIAERRGLLAAILLVAGLSTLTFLGFAAWSANRADRAVREVLLEEEALTRTFAKLAASIAEEIQVGERYLYDPLPVYQSRFHDLGQRVRELQRDLSLSASFGRAEAVTLAVAAERLARAEALYARAHRLTDIGRNAEARAVVAGALPAVDEMNRALGRMADLRADEVTRASLDLQQRTQRMAMVHMFLLSSVLAGMLGTIVLRRQKELSEVQLRADLNGAHLKALRMQMNPHFLLNALNSASSLIESGRGEEASDLIAIIGEMFLRTLSRGDSEMMVLQDELEFTRSYLAIELLRSGPQLEVEYQIQEGTTCAMVPVWVLQPLVENAVVHGARQAARRGQVRITVQRSGERLHLTVEDNGPGFGGSRDRGTGVGLSNVRKRLTHVLEGRGSLEVDRSPLGGARVSISLPFVPASETRAGGSYG